MKITTENLKNYDFVVAIDKSGSMGSRDCNGKSRWDHAKEQTEQFARVCEEFDDDGIDVLLFASNTRAFEGVTSSKVHQIFEENEPNGGTSTEKAIQKAFDMYNDRGRTKPMIVVCITDGEPNSEKDLADTIINISKKLKSDEDFGILFVQVGYDKQATAFLNRLDNNLTGAKFDIVSAVTCDESEDLPIKEMLIKAIND